MMMMMMIKMIIIIIIIISVSHSPTISGGMKGPPGSTVQNRVGQLVLGNMESSSSWEGNRVPVNLNQRAGFSPVRRGGKKKNLPRVVESRSGQ